MEQLNIAQFDDDKKMMISCLLNDVEYSKAKSLKKQLKIAVIYLRSDTHIKFSFEDMAKLFGTSKPYVYKIFKERNSPERSVGRPSILSDEAIECMVKLINDQYESKNPATFDMILDMLQYQYNISIKPDTLRHIIRARPEFKTVDGIPMERTRVLASEEDLNNWYEELKAEIEEIPGSFIFNVDETGCSSWNDAHEVRVIVPASYDGLKIKVPKDRNSKRSTLVACISGDGSALKPLVIVHRKTYEQEVFLYGYNSRNALFAYQENSFMTTVLFEQWADEIFFASVAERRKETNYTGPALLILDGLSSHHSAAFREACSERNIILRFLIPHTSDQVQPLDLVTFGILKRDYARMGFQLMQSKQSNQIVKMMGAWYQATAPHLVMSAFNAAGFVQFMRNGEIYMKVDREKAKRIRKWSFEGNNSVLGDDATKRISLKQKQD
jgi:hypothetical protein